MESFRQDLAYCLRQLVRNPAFTVVTVLTLALGIGANTAIFSVVHGALLRPLPYRDTERLVHIGYRPPAPGVESTRFSVPDLHDIRRQSRAFSSIVEYHSMAFSLLGRGEPDRVQTAVVSWSFFETLGVRPLLGRSFRPDDEQPGADPVLLLTNRYWWRRFGGDPKIVGQTLRMNDRPIRVVGVLPPLPEYPGKDDLYIPISACPVRSTLMEHARNRPMLTLYGRLGPGIDAAAASAELSTISARLFETYPDAHPDLLDRDVPVVSIDDELIRPLRPTVVLLLATVGLVLLLTCANVANLLLARLISREREIMLRLALGAGKGRLVRQLLTESLILALAGGAVGLAFAASGVGLLRSFASQLTPRASEISIEPTVLAFTLAVALLTGFAFGLAPAVQAVRRDLVSSLKEGGATTAGVERHLLRSAMVVAQVALSFTLLTMAGLTLHSLRNLQRVDAGFDPENVLTMAIDLPLSKYADRHRMRHFFASLLSEIDARPSVLSSGVASDLPLSGNLFTVNFEIEGRPTPPGRPAPKADLHIVSAGYFRSLGVPVLRGRPFADSDNTEAPPVVLINQSLALKAWPGEDPVGRRIRTTGSGDWATIVGVTGDVKQNGLHEEAAASIYTPFLQSGTGRMQVFVRTREDPMVLASDIRSLIDRIDPEQPVANLRTLADVRSDSMAPSRLTAILLGLFAGLAFAITAIGIGGVVASSVAERRQEIGIRTALGAKRHEVLQLILWRGMALALLGLVPGVLVAGLFTRLLSRLLFGIQPTDPMTFGAVALLLLLVTGIACLLPALRALKTHPVVALRR